MTDLQPTPTSGRGLRIALAVSVALNLAIAGVIGGALLRQDRPHPDGMPRDLGFGFFAEALTPENRADLRGRLVSSRPNFGEDRRALRQELAAILAALRAEPFDPSALERATQAQITRLQSRLDVGQALLFDFLADLPAAERRAFADRLEAALTRRPKKRGPDAAN